MSKYGTKSFEMLWDPNRTSWKSLRIPAQPAAILLTRDGAEIRRWFGAFPEDEVVSLAAKA